MAPGPGWGLRSDHPGKRRPRPGEEGDGLADAARLVALRPLEAVAGPGLALRRWPGELGQQQRLARVAMPRHDVAEQPHAADHVRRSQAERVLGRLIEQA